MSVARSGKNTHISRNSNSVTHLQSYSNTTIASNSMLSDDIATPSASIARLSGDIAAPSTGIAASSVDDTALSADIITSNGKCPSVSWCFISGLWYFMDVLQVFYDVLSCWTPCWKINSFLSEISVCWSCTKKITIEIEIAFFVILWALPATRRSFQQSSQLPTVAVANLRFNKQLATANARWRLPSPALVDCVIDSSTVCWHKHLLIEVVTVALTGGLGANVY